MEFAPRLPLNSRVMLPFQIWPLQVLKQIATMAIAMSYPESVSLPHFQELRRFVLKPRERHLPEPFRFYAYLVTDGLPRFTQTCVVLNTKTGRHAMVFAEIALPPLGYCVVAEREGEYSDRNAQGLANLDHWSKYDFDSLETIWLKIPRLDPCGPCALDYLSHRDESESEE